MNNLNQDAIDGINNLISRNKDAAEGFVEVANNINYTDLTNWLINQAKAHERYAEELQKVVKGNDETPENSTTLLGELHHAWIDLKAQFTNNDTEALLDECLRGEEQAILDYAEVLTGETISADVRTTLTRQHLEIKNEINQLNSLKNAYKKVDEVS